MKLSGLLAVSLAAAMLALFGFAVGAEEPTSSSAPSASDTTEKKPTEDGRQSETTEEGTTKSIEFASPDGRFAFLIGRGEYETTIDLVDKKTEKVLQHIDDSDMRSVSYRILWARDAKRFALMTRAGHPNQDVRVYFLKGDKFQQIEIPELEVEIPAKIRAGKEHPHVAANNWEEAQKWNNDGSLLITIDNTIDGAGHTASAERTVVLGFGKSDKAKILKSKVKYESRNDGDE